MTTSITLHYEDNQAALSCFRSLEHLPEVHPADFSEVSVCFETSSVEVVGIPPSVARLRRELERATGVGSHERTRDLTV